jgi:hypothetical protein
LGGFFPLILNRDYGWPALLAFTVFNVGGATAMGFYLKNREHQKRFVSEHKTAITSFSYVTLAYQLFFIAWLGSVIGHPLLIGAVLVIALAIYLSKNMITQWAWVLYAISFGLFIAFIGSDWPPVDFSARGYWPHALLPLAIGFIFSPYLDITFHRAYRQSDKPKASFVIGFCVLFLSLIGFVFLYSAALGDVFFFNAIPAAIIYPIVGFLVLQTAFTVAAHCGELREQNIMQSRGLATLIGGISMAALGILTLFKDTTIPLVNLPLEETIYKSFLFFYSLVFPLYLLLKNAKSMYFWTLAICTPAYSIGFLIGGSYSFTLSIGSLLILAVIAFKWRQGTRLQYQ